MKKNGLYLIFLLIVLGEMAAIIFKIRGLAFICKPLLVPAIALIFFIQAKNAGKKILWLMASALFFSWGGDVLLMLGYFQPGLASFLFAQISYIFLFLHLNSLYEGCPFLKRRPAWLSLYVVYGAIIYLVLFSRLDLILKPAVFIYMCALITMSAMALNRYGKVGNNSFYPTFIGSSLFVASDSLIAINKFLAPIPYEGLLIMGTYIAAQYLIMKGVLKQVETA